VTLDFETYFDDKYNLDNLTTEAYVRDPRFEVIGVGVSVDGARSVWLEEWEFRAWAASVDWARVAVCAHHAHFDCLILSHHYGIKPGFILCTMSMARALHGLGSGSLAFLGPHYNLGVKGDELIKAKGKRRRDFTQTAWLEFGSYCNNDVDLTDPLLRKMAKGFPRTELWLIDSTVRMFTEPVFVGDLAVLRKALKEERERKAALYARIATKLPPFVPNPRSRKPPPTQQERVEEVLGSPDKFAALLLQFGGRPQRKKSPSHKCNEPGKKPCQAPCAKTTAWAFAKTDAAMQALLEDPDEEIRLLAEARLEVKSTIIGSRTERVIGAAQRGAIPFYLNYCGAHTHRWSGGDKMNPQNFNRGGALRDAILAAIGYMIAVTDSGQIEARVLAWLARAATILETFRRNDAMGQAGDFYSDVGSAFFLRKLSKKETPVERQLAKNMVLGLGFGMGWFKFACELLKGMLGSKPVQFTMKEVRQFNVDLERFLLDRDGDPDAEKTKRIREMPSRLSYDERVIHCAVADHFVRLYRKTYAEIPRLWKAMEEVLAVMAQPGGRPDEVRMTFGPLKVVHEGIICPGGLKLRYPGLHRTKEGWKYLGGDSGKELKKIYGGLLTENVVQKLARDIVGEQALWIRAAGYKFGTMSHDEVVSVPREDDADECLRYSLERMKIPPAWCLSLPLNAEGGTGRSYGDAK
jgi:hypothetical protein